MTTAEKNYRLLQEIDASRTFLLMAYQQNPKFPETAELRSKQIYQVNESCETDAVSTPEISKQRGISLIELILFIVIISVAVAGILLVMNQVTGRSADALVRKQALAIAESLLEEIELQAMSGVTPDPVPATNAARATFDNVFNYAGYNTTAGILDFSTNLAVPGLENYNVAPDVTVVAPAAAPWNAMPAGSAVVITVSVTGPGGVIAVTGYRAGN
jgi:MSHA pilin protein MshD